MAEGGQKYIVRTPAGVDLEPADRQRLIEWAEAGRIEADWQVRSTLLSRWSQLEDLPFLEAAFQARPAVAPAAAPPPAAGLGDKVREAMGKRAVADHRPVELHAPGTFVFTPGDVVHRLAAGLTDAAIIAVWVGVLTAGMILAVSLGLASPAVAFYVTLALAYVGAVLYLAWTIGFGAQTVGQWFWGLMVVCSDGQPVFLGRAFAFACGALFLGWLTPVMAFLLPSRRAIHDLISGTRVVRIRIIYSAQQKA